MIHRIVIPSRLAVTIVVATAGCVTPSPVGDAGDVADRPDRNDVGNAETCSAVPPQGYRCLPDLRVNPSGMCPFEIVCTPSECPTGCPACAASSSTFEYGVTCIVAAGADAAVVCPGRVCTAADCPSGCISCTSALFCITDTTIDAGVACAGGVACRPEDCPAGCRAVG